MVPYLAYKHPRVPRYAQPFGVRNWYGVSRIDLIIELVPVVGYHLDDLDLIHVGIAISTRRLPSDVLPECRQKVQAAATEGKPVNRIAAVIVVAVDRGCGIGFFGYAVHASRDVVGALALRRLAVGRSSCVRI